MIGRMRCDADGCGWSGERRRLPLPLRCPRCGRRTMNRLDWIMWVLMVGWSVVIPLDRARRLLAARFRGRPGRLVHVMMSTRGEVRCADCGEAWGKDHVCDAVAVN